MVMIKLSFSALIVQINSHSQKKFGDSGGNSKSVKYKDWSLLDLSQLIFISDIECPVGIL